MTTTKDIRPEKKPCAKCGITKVQERFTTKKSKTKAGITLSLASYCKACVAKDSAAYYRKNFDEVNARQKQYYKDNREHQLKVQRDYIASLRANVTYRLDWANGTYWIGSTVCLKRRIHLHTSRLARGKHSPRVMELCGAAEFEVTTLETFETQAEARAAEYALLQEHVGQDLCLNTMIVANMQGE